MNGLLSNPQTIIIHQLGKTAVTRLIDQDESRHTFEGQAATDQEKIPQMGAQQQHSFTLGKRRIEMLATDNRNFRLKLGIGSYDCDPDLHTSAKKITQRAARDTTNLTGTQAVAQSNANIGDRTITKSAKKVEPDPG